MRLQKGQGGKPVFRWVARFIDCLRGSSYAEEETEVTAPDKNGETQGPVSEVTAPEIQPQEIDMGFGVLLISGALIGAGLGLSRIRIPFQERELFERIGAEENVNADLLHAIAWQESNVNPEAISPPNKNRSRDYGMMQINERNFALLGLSQLTALNAERNVRAAARLIQGINAAGVSDVADILSIYNAGDAKFKPYGSGPRLRNGKYVNQNYVTTSMGKLTLVRIANFLPFLRSVPA